MSITIEAFYMSSSLLSDFSINMSERTFKRRTKSLSHHLLFFLCESTKLSRMLQHMRRKLKRMEWILLNVVSLTNNGKCTMYGFCVNFEYRKFLSGVPKWRKSG